MPNIKSAAKKVRQDKKRAARNLAWRRRAKTAVKSYRQNRNAGLLKTTQSALDKAAARGVIKRGKASRLKSRLSKLVPAQ